MICDMNYKNYGLLGKTLSHSLSPEIHTLMFKYTKLEGSYKLFPVEEGKIKDIINMVECEKLAGLNVTIPYKTAVMPLLDKISVEASKIGSVNTIMKRYGKLYGYNSDYFGFMRTLEVKGINIKSKNCAVLGSGGSSKSICAVLSDMGAKEITIVSRNPDKTTVINGVKIKNYEILETRHNMKIMINTTPVGMFPDIDKSPVSIETLKKFDAVVDLIYNPYNTVLLQYASKLNLKNANGLYMLVAQAVRSQEIWNDLEIGFGIIDKIYNELKQLQLKE